MASFKIEAGPVLLKEPIQKSKETDWLGLKDIGANLIGNSIDLFYLFPKRMQRSMLLLKVFSRINNQIVLRGWTYFYYFENEIEQTGNWILPLYLPPISKVVNGLTAKEWWAFAHVYISVGIDTEKTILADYMESPQHPTVKKELRFYDEWAKKAQKKQTNVKDKVETLRTDLEQVKTFLEDEQGLIDRLRNREIKVTEKIIKDLAKVLDKKRDKALRPIKNRIKELLDLLEKQRDGGTARTIEELTCRKKIGVKVTINWLEDIFIHDAVKVYMTVVQGENVVVDDLQNQAKYNTQRIEDFVNVAETEKKMDLGKPFDVEVDEMFFIIKNLELFLKKFGKKKRVFLVFKVFEALGDPYFDNEDNNKRFLDSYILKEKLVSLGTCYFELKYNDMSLNIGRYKRDLFESIDGPYFPFKNKNKKISRIDFTIETFEYDEENMDNFVLRFKRRKKKKQKDEIFVDKRPFIPNDERQYTEKIFEKGSGIDFYIDGARYLPNSTTVTKVVLRIVDSNLKDTTAPSSKTSELDCAVFDPVFNFKKELRFPYYDPTLMAVIQLLSVDDKDIDELRPQLLGIAFFPLFLAKETRQQPETAFEKEFFLMDGKYQLPLFCQQYFQQKPFLYKNQ